MCLVLLVRLEVEIDVSDRHGDDLHHAALAALRVAMLVTVLMVVVAAVTMVAASQYLGLK